MDNLVQAKVVEVENPSKILRELDNIGVNYGSIYGDFDSIAKYIKNKSIDGYKRSKA